MGSRVTFIIFCFAAFYAGLVYKIYTIQIEDAPKYVELAEARNNIDELNTPRRGVIYFTDNDGKKIPASMDKEYPSIVATPKKIHENGDIPEVAHTLAPVLNTEPKFLEKAFSNKNSEYSVLAEKVEKSVISAVENAIKDSPIQDWIYVKSKFSRFYPNASSSAHLIGFVGETAENITPSGRYGLEAFYEDELKGSRGDVIGDRILSSEAGQDIETTIDANIQKRAAEILDGLVHQYGARGGSVIVENPKTGEILAMVSSPTFDPNEFSQYNISSFLNPTVQAIYEPGSIFKVITMAAGIDSGKITPQTTYTDIGSVTLSGKKIQNWDLKAHGTLTMTEVIMKSVNTGAVYAQRQTGNKTFLSYLQKFGFGEKTGIDLPGELAGDLTNLEKGEIDIEYANASFGQGVAVTPIELLRAISAIANDGVMMRPYINKKLGEKKVGEIITSDSAEKVTNMMVAAVDGAKIAAIPNYSIAGKTGTAQAVDFVYGGYTKDVINTYVGFGPASDAQFIILVKLDKPAGAPLAGLTVVPAFRNLAEFIINYYNVPPDRISQ